MYFPQTLRGVCFEKASKLYEGEGTIFFDKNGFLSLILPLLPKERPKGKPRWKPQNCIFFNFLFFSKNLLIFSKFIQNFESYHALFI